MVTLILYLLSGHNDSLYFSAHTFERIMPSLSRVSVLSIRYTCLLAREYAVRLPRIASKPMQSSTLVFIPKTTCAPLVARPRCPKIHLLLFYTMYQCLAAVLTRQIFLPEVLTYRIRQCMIETTRRDNHIETYMTREVEPSRASVLH